MADAIVGTGLIRIHASPAGPVAALRGLDITVGSGEVAAVIGPSGSGKSTLLRLVAGLDRPSAGRLTVLGEDLALASDRGLERHRREHVGIVEQHYRRALSPYLTVAAGDRPAAGPARRRARSSDPRRVDELLERIGLPDRGGAFRHELSGGEQQRVAFAVALATRPPLLLADEPTGELDAVTAETILGVLRDLVRAEGSTCLVVTHDELVERVADRVIHVADGRAVAERVGGPGSPPLPVRDAQGWLAPPLPEPSTPLSPAVRPDDGTDAVVLERAARRYGTGTTAMLGLPPTSVALRAGRFHVVTGPSGSGKTTLLRLVAGLDRPTDGRVVTLGTDLATLDRDGLAHLPRGAHRHRRPGPRPRPVPDRPGERRAGPGDPRRHTGRRPTPGRGGPPLGRAGRPPGAGARRTVGRRAAAGRAGARDGAAARPADPRRTDGRARPGRGAVGGSTAGRLDDARVTVLATTHDPALIEAGQRPARPARARRRGSAA